VCSVWVYHRAITAVQKQRALIEQQRKELANLKQTIHDRITKDVRAPIKEPRPKTVRSPTSPLAHT
jgi:hypothetical protein